MYENITGVKAEHCQCNTFDSGCLTEQEALLWSADDDGLYDQTEMNRALKTINVIKQELNAANLIVDAAKYVANASSSKEAMSRIYEMVDALDIYDAFIARDTND